MENGHQGSAPHCSTATYFPYISLGSRYTIKEIMMSAHRPPRLTTHICTDAQVGYKSVALSKQRLQGSRRSLLPPQQTRIMKLVGHSPIFFAPDLSERLLTHGRQDDCRFTPSTYAHASVGGPYLSVFHSPLSPKKQNKEKAPVCSHPMWRSCLRSAFVDPLVWCNQCDARR